MTGVINAVKLAAGANPPESVQNEREMAERPHQYLADVAGWIA